MKIIFLDIDGVVNTIHTKLMWKQYIGIEPALVARFNDIVKKTGAKVVLSSSWRKDKNWRRTMHQNGFDFMFLDRTGESQPLRGMEVDEWLARHRGTVECYAILDDCEEFREGEPFFHTPEETGLTQEIADKVVAHLL